MPEKQRHILVLTNAYGPCRKNKKLERVIPFPPSKMKWLYKQVGSKCRYKSDGSDHAALRNTLSASM